jgi:hypothetical protein
MSSSTLVRPIKFGSNRGQRRVWLESATLAAYGFTRGDAITVDFVTGFTKSDRHIRIERTIDASPHSVAGRERNNKALSIIDINSAELTRFLDGAPTGTVTYTNGLIVIEVTQ